MPADPPSPKPRTWLLLSDKLGDNAQVHALSQAIGWPATIKTLQMRDRYVLGKPRFRPSLQHIDLERSDKLEAPWPDLIITIGRRPSMVALWIKQQNPSVKIVLVGRPKRWLERFDLIIAPPQFQMPQAPNVFQLKLPLMRADEERVNDAAERWRSRLADMPRPLTAVLVGGQTRPFRFDRINRVLLWLQNSSQLDRNHWRIAVRYHQQANPTRCH